MSVKNMSHFIYRSKKCPSIICLSKICPSKKRPGAIPLAWQSLMSCFRWTHIQPLAPPRPVSYDARQEGLLGERRAGSSLSAEPGKAGPASASHIKVLKDHSGQSQSAVDREQNRKVYNFFNAAKQLPFAGHTRIVVGIVWTTFKMFDIDIPC